MASTINNIPAVGAWRVGWEVNLITCNGKRLMVIHQRIAENAGSMGRQIAKFLKLPLSVSPADWESREINFAKWLDD